MSHKFLFDARTHEALGIIDSELAEAKRLQGCPCCGGRLDHADYPRSPFGIPTHLRSFYQTRFSFCCAACRKRTTSPSVRFFGRRWFPAPLLILISALQCGATEFRCKQIRELFGIVLSPSTWKRWRYWWRTSFTETDFWKQAKGLTITSHFNGWFPRELFSLFNGALQEKLFSLLKFLSPLTSGFFRAV